MTHCKRGHPLRGENLYVSPKGLRQCIACRRERQRRYYDRNREQVIARSAELRAANPDRTAECRSRYLRKGDQMRAATEQWRRNNPEKVRDIRENRRARERAAFVEHVDRALVHRAAEGRCGICGSPVSLSEMELDHIVPLSRGGLHEHSNVQPAHMVCNRRKFNKLEVPAHAA